MKNVLKITLLGLLIILFSGCNFQDSNQSLEEHFDYTNLSRLTDPGENAGMLKSLPSDIEGICDIANVQLVHYRMLSQWEIPRDDWLTARSQHHIVVVSTRFRC